jgi:gluconolactonase
MQRSVFADQVLEPEGPAFGPHGEFYLVEMATERSSVLRIVDGEKSVVARTAARPNGLAIDGEGNIWIAEAHEGAIICFSPDGRVRIRIDGDRSGRFLWPNDLAFGPDGLLYMTDSGVIDTEFIDGVNIRPDFATVPYDGRVYQIDPRLGVVLQVIDRGFRFTNGLAFDAAGLLYVNETLSGDIFRYDLSLATPRREPYANVLRSFDDGLFRGPDGMKFDAAGNLYCAVYNQGEIAVIDAKGVVVDRLRTNGAKPTNMAFEPGGDAMYVTEVESSTIQIIHARNVGLPLHHPSTIAS